MNEYKNPETMKSVIDYIEADGDAVFREVFRNRLWRPIAGSALLISAVIVHLMVGTDPVTTTLNVAVLIVLGIMVWGSRYMRSEVAAAESKYAHAMSYLDELEDEDAPDA